MKLAEVFSAHAPTRAAEQLLEDLADSLEIPPSRYEAAERSYKSVGQWLDRPDSLFVDVEATIYAQGSFRLGTVIRPLNGEEDYDLDVACELSYSKRHLTQQQLKSMLGIELRA
jgi:Cyclic GMP-AMP synthase DncV-like, nucleotidyltransferase domain